MKHKGEVVGASLILSIYESMPGGTLAEVTEAFRVVTEAMRNLAEMARVGGLPLEVSKEARLEGFGHGWRVVITARRPYSEATFPILHQWAKLTVAQYPD